MDQTVVNMAVMAKRRITANEEKQERENANLA
jgi:hypothetical protein